MIYPNIEKKASDILKEADCFQLGFDLNKLLKRFQIVLNVVELDSNISGFLAEKDEVYYISVNKSHSEKRRRFTISHELGHFFLHKHMFHFFVDKDIEYKLNRDSKSQTGEIRMEREANAFAAALLMPIGLINEELGNYSTIDEKSIKEIARNFKVSEQALIIRLSNLEIDFGYF